MDNTSYELKSIGTDPEVFVTHNGKVISAIGLIGGSKTEPLKVDRGALQEDNVLAEFNIAPATTSKEFISNIRHVMRQLQEMIGPDYGLEIKSSHNFTKSFLNKAGPKAMEFGCDPDFNPYLLDINRSPNPFSTLRTAGGHVHACFELKDMDLDPFKAAIMMDYFLGIPSVILDEDTMRREMYGKAGACRPKLVEVGDEYDGVEYRSLSNFWLKSDNLIEWVFNNTSEAIKQLSNMKYFFDAVSKDEVQRIINSGDKQAAINAVKLLGIPMPEAA